MESFSLKVRTLLVEANKHLILMQKIQNKKIKN